MRIYFFCTSFAIDMLHNTKRRMRITRYILALLLLTIGGSISSFAQIELPQKPKKESLEMIREDQDAIKERLRKREIRARINDSMMAAALKEKERYDGKSEWAFMHYTIEKGDTIFIGQLPMVFVFAKSRQYQNNKQWRQYRRLVYNFNKVYPYAMQARRIIYEADSVLAVSNFTDKEREAYIESYQKRLFAQFEKPIRKLTISQGTLLLKLIDRELGRTSFYIIREYRGRLSAGFWQTVARIFGHNLKKPYDKFGEDRQVEDLVLLYQSGAFEGLYFSMFGTYK